MKITALKAQVKNSERVSVFVDGKYTFSLTLNEVLAYKLKKDLEVTEADIEMYKKLSADGKLRARVYEWLMGRPHSTKELRDYLYKKKTDTDLQEKLILEFSQNGMLNDQRYAEWAVERLDRKQKSKRAIANELRAKGIDAETIQSVISNEHANDAVHLQSLIQKLQARPRYSDPKKLTAYLISKGFSYEDIKQSLSVTQD